MSAISRLDSDFAFVGAAEPEAVTPAIGDPLGPLAELPGPGATPGVWAGHGFNAIWRPHRLSSGQDRFLELNLTDDKIVFTRIDGQHPEPRGRTTPKSTCTASPTCSRSTKLGTRLRGCTSNPASGRWYPRPATRLKPPTVVRMASIPHGTVINAQGVFQVIAGGPQNIPDNNILPFFFGSGCPQDLSSSTRWR